MATEVKLLKIASDGSALEFNTSDDQITLLQYAVYGGGPVLSGTGLDLNAQDVSDIKNITFNNSATATIAVNATTFVADKLMFETKENSVAVGAAVLFPVVSDAAGEVDALRVPALAGAPTATPADGGTGYLVFDSTGKNMYVWDGAAWDNMNTVSTCQNIDQVYTADEALAARDVVYISAADNVSKADADTAAKSYAIGFATAAALDTASVNVRKNGVVTGFTGLTAGARQFLSAGTAGTITESVPTGTGNTIVQVGYAKNTTDVDVQIMSLGRRA